MKPITRQDKLLVQEVHGELVIYDEERDRAHHLNRTASLVWRHCDGEKSVADIAAALQKELNPAADENLVWVSLDHLGAVHLLQAPMQRSVEQIRLSRRSVVQKVGMVGVLSLLMPAVTSIVAPTPAHAQSPGGCEGCEGSGSS
jgi:hypothetical protein